MGRTRVDGAASAVLRTTRTEDLDLPEAVARDLTAGVLLLNDEAGTLLFLPYAGELVIAYNLEVGEPAYPPMAIPRVEDRGLRLAMVRVVPQFGVVYLTETTLAGFHEDCTAAWRRDEDFAGWTIEGITNDEVLLLTADWAGNEQRQSRSLTTGNLVG